MHIRNLPFVSQDTSLTCAKMFLMIRKYLSGHQATLFRDMVFAADDGLITTFAIVAGATGASFTPEVAVVLGFANIVADGLSLASGVYLGVKSELESSKKGDSLTKIEGSPFKHGLVTFLSFTAFGFLILVPYLFELPHKFIVATVIVGLSLVGIGIWKSVYSAKSMFASALEVLLIGGVAATLAYLVGTFAETLFKRG